MHIVCMMCFLGWIDTSGADHDVLSYSQLQLIDGAMEITLTVTVKDDLSWTVHYRRNLVSRDNCTLRVSKMGTVTQGVHFVV